MRDPINPFWSVIIALVFVSFVAQACHAAEAPAAQPVNLDPSKPADAVQIIDVLTRQLTLPRDQAIALTVAIETLRRLAAQPPAPTPDAKPKD
jgi:hypothetical protein